MLPLQVQSLVSQTNKKNVFQCLSLWILFFFFLNSVDFVDLNISFPILGKFSAIICFNKFSAPFLSPSLISIMCILGLPDGVL